MKIKIILAVCGFLVIACLALAIATAHVHTRAAGTTITWEFGKLYVEYLRYIIDYDPDPRWTWWIRIVWGYR